MAHILQRGHTLREIEGVLFSRLVQSKPLETLCQTLEREMETPQLLAWHPLPDLSNALLVRTLQGHTDRVNSCAVSPDGSWIVSASDDQTLRVWNATTGAVQLTLAGHSGGVRGCAVSSDGTWIVSTSQDETLKVWDVHQGCCVATFFSDGPLLSCAILPDGEHLVAAGERGVYFLRVLW